MAYNGNFDYRETITELQVTTGVIQALKRAENATGDYALILINFPELELGVEIPKYDTY